MMQALAIKVLVDRGAKLIESDAAEVRKAVQEG
jgi:hypothetical protein